MDTELQTGLKTHMQHTMSTYDETITFICLVANIYKDRQVNMMSPKETVLRAQLHWCVIAVITSTSPRAQQEASDGSVSPSESKYKDVFLQLLLINN